MGEDVIYLDDRVLKRAELFDRVQLLIAAASLLMPSVERLRGAGTADLVLAGLQLVTCAAVVVSVAVWARRRHAMSAARVGWLDLAAGVMLLVEWTDRWLHGGKVFSPVLCQAAVFIALAVLHAPLSRRKRRGRWIRVSEEGIGVRSSPLRRFRMAWADVATVTREPGHIRITRRDGTSRSIGLRRLENAEDVARFVLGHAAVRGLATRQ
jgi:hypothetical protein